MPAHTISEGLEKSCRLERQKKHEKCPLFAAYAWFEVQLAKIRSMAKLVAIQSANHVKSISTMLSKIPGLADCDHGKWKKKY
mmetsp:Transcript_100162/g.164625  ORF Transcript_100162/g.164625 Transcript_100162/m.164625 type:complete len:82 (-) Transcript_100162:7-252(-)